MNKKIVKAMVLIAIGIVLLIGMAIIALVLLKVYGRKAIHNI